MLAMNPKYLPKSPSNNTERKQGLQRLSLVAIARCSGFGTAGPILDRECRGINHHHESENTQTHVSNLLSSCLSYSPKMKECLHNLLGGELLGERE